MKISDLKITSATLTGRSGVNLDERGSMSADNLLTCWVLDGVSPIIFKRTHALQYRKFYYAGKFLNKLFLNNNWNNIESDLRRIAREIKIGPRKSIFIRGYFFHWPLFSCGFVQVNADAKEVKVLLYGDCVILEEREQGVRKIEYKELEDRKYRLNRIFEFFDRFLNDKLSTCLRRIVFSAIRIEQIWFGKSRVFSVNKYFPPPVVDVFSANGLKGIYILSDGASWYLKTKRKAKMDIIDSIKERGVEKTLSWLRSLESINTNFGRYDDATILAITF